MGLGLRLIGVSRWRVLAKDFESFGQGYRNFHQGTALGLQGPGVRFQFFMDTLFRLHFRLRLLMARVSRIGLVDSFARLLDPFCARSWVQAWSRIFMVRDEFSVCVFGVVCLGYGPAFSASEGSAISDLTGFLFGPFG